MMLWPEICEQIAAETDSPADWLYAARAWELLAENVGTADALENAERCREYATVDEYHRRDVEG